MKPALRRIDRDERTLQFGVQPGWAVMMSDLTQPVRRWIDALDGTRDLAQVLREAVAAGLDEAGAQSLLDQLVRRGVLHDAATAPLPLPLAELDRLRPDLDAMDLASTTPDGGREAMRRRREARVRVYGAGRVGAQVVALLAAAGVGTIRVIDPEPTRPGDITPGGLTWSELGLSRQDGAVALARRTTTPPIAPAPPGPAPDRPRRSAPSAPSARQAHPLATGPGHSSHPDAGARRQARTPDAEPGRAPHPRRQARPLDAESGRAPHPGGGADRQEASVDVKAGGPYLGDGTQRPDLVILAPVRPLDGVLVNELIALGIPHLLVSAFEGHGCVGPLVLPGQTACLHCLDLARRDHDPAWPIVTARLGGYPPGEIACDAVLASLVAATATAHVLAHIEGRAAVVTNGTVEVSPDWHWKRRPWVMHPQCRCRRNHPHPFTMVMSATCD